jgi:hypothetical protein
MHSIGMRHKLKTGTAPSAAAAEGRFPITANLRTGNLSCFCSWPGGATYRRVRLD